MQGFDHTFVVPAYKYSEHLSDCIKSLRSQSMPTAIRVTTSTPDGRAEAVCRRFGVDYLVHDCGGGIAADWNHALGCTESKWVTLAHQDDLYYPEYARRVGDALGEEPGAIIAFTNYDEVVGSHARGLSRLLLIKRVLLEFGFVGRKSITDSFSKRNSLRFACPIPCPSVTANVDRLREFDGSFEVNLDWATWLNAADAEGAFVWVREALIGHRIHESSETSLAIGDGRRQAEDMRILLRLWPEWMAKMISNSYQIAYASNKVGKWV